MQPNSILKFPNSIKFEIIKNYCNPTINQHFKTSEWKMKWGGVITLCFNFLHKINFTRLKHILSKFVVYCELIENWFFTIFRIRESYNVASNDDPF
jgi:hypothetical protein